MAFDPFLYLAFAGGFLVGRLVKFHPPWVARATLGTVVVLVGLLGASLASEPWTPLVATIPLAIGFAVLVLALTAAVYLALSRVRPAPPAAPEPAPARERIPLSVVLLATLVVGFLLGRAVPVPSSAAIPWVLCLLLALVGFEIPLHFGGLPEVWKPLLAASVGAVGAAAVFIVLLGVPTGVAFATAFAFGFYSLAGPLVVARAGALFGLLAFLTNFLREDFTMVASPYVGRALGGAGLAAMGGATSMDTTLYFVTRYGDRGAGSLALANGLALTIAATLLLPVLLTLPV